MRISPVSPHTVFGSRKGLNVLKSRNNAQFEREQKDRELEEIKQLTREIESLPVEKICNKINDTYKDLQTVIVQNNLKKPALYETDGTTFKTPPLEKRSFICYPKDGLMIGDVSFYTNTDKKDMVYNSEGFISDGKLYTDISAQILCDKIQYLEFASREIGANICDQHDHSFIFDETQLRAETSSKHKRTIFLFNKKGKVDKVFYDTTAYFDDFAHTPTWCREVKAAYKIDKNGNFIEEKLV